MDYTENTEQHGLYLIKKAVASVMSVSSVPNCYPANPADSHKFTRVGADLVSAR